jgi:hypothetical protein
MGTPDKSREARLAAALRENLRRRKEQSRELTSEEQSVPTETEAEEILNRSSAHGIPTVTRTPTLSIPGFCFPNSVAWLM